MAAVPTGSRPSTPVPHELRFDAGRLCLDLVATAHPEERLISPDRLRSWLAGAGLVPDGGDLPSCAAAWLPAFRELRGHIGRLVRGELAGRPAPAALERVNLLARAAPP
ncbi:hypothetical protein GTW43_19970, partial [Streptomyces sp. SID5785]|uniref:ABATE domain-containing protein n=1 Tax=Streptomyces sp. SID5785 TaxID=2690309 RepID=UPI001361BEAF